MGRIKFFIPALIWFITDCILFTLPASVFGVKHWYNKIPNFDKIVHIGLLSTLVTLICWGISKQNIAREKLTRYFVISTVACILYGVAIEFIQKNFIPNRTFDVGDIGADAVGAIVGLLFCLKFVKKN